MCSCSTFPAFFVKPPTGRRPALTHLSHACLLAVGMSVQCRVEGCGRWLRSFLGERRHVLHVHPGASELENPPIDTICIESDEPDEPESHGAAVEGTATEAGTGTVGVRGVLGLESEVFLELARTLTRRPPPFPPSPRRRGRVRRGTPSERPRRARRTDADAQKRRRRNGSRSGPANQRDGSVGDDEESDGDPPRRWRGEGGRGAGGGGGGRGRRGCRCWC